MAQKSFKPTTPSLRQMTVSSFDTLTTSRPEKSLTKGKKSTGGRNNQGRITTRFRGGGVKRRYRQIDFKRDKNNISATVAEIEYDPNRTARIALLHYADGEKRYIIAPENLSQGDKVMSGAEAPLKTGNALKIKDIPDGMELHNIELIPGRGAVLARSAGLFATLRSKDGKYAQLKLPSGEIRMIHVDCYATIGKVSNSEHSKINIGKAGKKRYMGRRPHVRGVAMNPVDHPMGGGEGRTSGGGHPQSPWGQLAKGKKTRSRRKSSSKYIVERSKK